MLYKVKTHNEGQQGVTFEILEDGQPVGRRPLSLRKAQQLQADLKEALAKHHRHQRFGSGRVPRV